MFKRCMVLVMLIVGVGLTTLRAASAQNGRDGCALAARLVQGQNGRVLPGLPNVIRFSPGRGSNSPVIGEMPAGAEFFVTPSADPVCVNGYRWWLVSYNGTLGWTAEGDVYGPYWTEPITASYPPTTVVSTCLLSRMVYATRGVVTPGLPNVIRTQPFRGSGSRVTGYIPAGGIFTVWSQSYSPNCNTGITWIYVTYNGQSGWTPESDATSYWVDPI